MLGSTVKSSGDGDWAGIVNQSSPAMAGSGEGDHRYLGEKYAGSTWAHFPPHRDLNGGGIEGKLKKKEGIHHPGRYPPNRGYLTSH